MTGGSRNADTMIGQAFQGVLRAGTMRSKYLPMSMPTPAGVQRMESGHVLSTVSPLARRAAFFETQNRNLGRTGYSIDLFMSIYKPCFICSI